MCEIKFYGGQFEVNKSIDLKIRNQLNLLYSSLSKKQIIHNTLITTFGLKNNEYSGIFANVITLDDLFKE